MNYVVYGLQRSGTNYLETLLKNSFKDVKILNAYEYNAPWKHAFDINHDIATGKARVKYKDGKPVDYHSEGTYKVETYDYWIGRLRSVNAILLTKHPFTWIDSVKRKHVDMNRFKLFSRNQSAAMFARIYKEHHTFWAEQRKQQRIMHVRYEDLLEGNRVKSIINNIALFYDDSVLKEPVIPRRVSMSEPFNEQKKEKYRSYKTGLNEQEQKEVMDILGEEIFNDYRYPYQIV